MGSLRPTDNSNTPSRIVYPNIQVEYISGVLGKKKKLDKGTICVKNQCPFMVQVICCPDQNKIYQLATSFNISLDVGPNQVGAAYGQEKSGALARTGVPPGSRYLKPNSEGIFNVDGGTTYITITDVEKRSLGMVNDRVCEQQTLILS